MKKSIPIEIIPLPFHSPAFRAAWEEWLTYRKERKLPKYVPTGIVKTFGALLRDSDKDETVAIAMIENAIANNWQGIHPLKTNNGTKKQTPNSNGAFNSKSGGFQLGLNRLKENLAAGGTAYPTDEI